MKNKIETQEISQIERNWALEAIDKSYSECDFQWQIDRLNQMKLRYKSEQFPITKEEFNSDIRLMMTFYDD